MMQYVVETALHELRNPTANNSTSNSNNTLNYNLKNYVNISITFILSSLTLYVVANFLLWLFIFSSFYIFVLFIYSSLFKFLFRHLPVTRSLSTKEAYHEVITLLAYMQQLNNTLCEMPSKKKNQESSESYISI